MRCAVSRSTPGWAVSERQFTKTWRELDLGEDETVPPDGLSFFQVASATNIGEGLSPVLGALLNHGLIEERHSQGGASFYGGGGGEAQMRGFLSLTEFGRSLLTRMKTIGVAESDGGRCVSEDGEAATPVRALDYEESESCVICPEKGYKDGYASGPWANVPKSDEPGGLKLVAIALCKVHKEAYHGNRVGIGWCAGCRQFGEARKSCRCGSEYVRVI